ncbi:MAG: hypothetical protein KDK24_18665 [Pseudooceanicola sp.]|nr:hypothetical protein [Pseudooceanicola sp.]
MTTATMDDKALLAVPERPAPPPASLIVEVARKFGVSPITQFREMTRLHFGQGRIAGPEYYASGLYDPEMPFEDKRAYVGLKGNRKLNDRLSPSELATMQNFVANKVMFTALVRQLGIATTETQGVVSNLRHYGTLPNPAGPVELARFLKEEARFPLFGKPTAYSGSFGSVLLERIEGEMLVLGNGRQVRLDAFCKEIFDEYAGGYVFQTALQQHPDMETMTGRAVGSIRIVTVRESGAPRVLYALWKIPSPKAMSDNFWQDGSMIAPLDVATGTVGQARTGTGLHARDIEMHPVSHRAIKGFQVPHWAAAREAACMAHALFPDYGAVGWDVAITPEGPAIIELNDNPFHTLYQLSHGRGVLNPDFAPVFDRVAEVSAKMLEDRKARQKARKDQHKRS